MNDRLQVVCTAELSHLAAYHACERPRRDSSQNSGEGAEVNASRATFLQVSNPAAGAEFERAVEASDYFTGPSQQAHQGAYDAVQKLWATHVAQAETAKDQGRASVLRANLMLSGGDMSQLLAGALTASFVAPDSAGAHGA